MSSESPHYTNNTPPVPGLVKVPVERTGTADSPFRRVAKFLLLIGQDEAARVLAGLASDQVEKVVLEIASIRRVDQDEAAIILAEFESLLTRAREPSGGISTARGILEAAFGTEKAADMLRKAVPQAEGRPFDYLEGVDSERIAFVLAGELPAVKALVLSQLQSTQAAKVIKQFSDTEKKDVVLRLAKLTRINPDVLRRVDESVREKMQGINTKTAESVDGRTALAEILRRMDGSSEKEILDSLAGTDPDLGRDIRERLFTLDDIVHADDRFMQEVLRPMTERDIAILLAGKNENFRTKILANVSRTRGAAVLEEEGLIRPLARSDSERVTSEFFIKMRRGWEEGKFMIQGRDDKEVWIQ